MGYKYILLDADNTIFDFTLSEYNALHIVFEKHGVDLSPDQHEAYHVINDNLWKALERGETTREKLKVQRFEEFVIFLGIDLGVTAEQIAAEYVSALSNERPLMNGADDLCSYLSDKYELYIITNGITSIQHNRFDASPIRKYFNGMFISDEIGFNKPQKEFFDFVCDKIGDNDLSNYIVIGDSLSSDIQGAVNFGCDSVWISPEGKNDCRPTYTVKHLQEICDIL